MTEDVLLDAESDDSGLTIRPDSVLASSTSSAVTTSTNPHEPTSPLAEQYRDLWRDYFVEKISVESPAVQGITFNAYHKPPRAKGTNALLYITHHGAGSSALTFLALIKELSILNPTAGFLAIDARGHGDTVVTSGSTEIDYSLATLCTDFKSVLEAFLSRNYKDCRPQMVLIGHSMGGAVVSHIAKEGSLKSLIGVTVIDVVEGSAIDALTSMQKYLSTRPSSFTSVEAAIDWHISSRTLRNRSSAALSVPSLLHYDALTRSWVWRTDLSLTRSFWADWFTGLSDTFLAAKCGKQLLLAGTDRLDKPLMIAQVSFQGFPTQGHRRPDRMTDTT